VHVNIYVLKIVLG